MKRKICLILALLMLAMLCLPACDGEESNEDDPKTSTTANPQGGSQTPADVSGYSQILQNILLDEHYNDLIASVTNENNVLDGWEFKPHPYAFYERQGLDVEAIKKYESDAYTMSYVLEEEPNNLYIYTRVMQDNSYWANYLLKYTLTEQEMKDYHELHSAHPQYHYYIQAVFMNNEIAKTREPEIVGEAKIDITAFDKITDDLQNVQLFEKVQNKQVIFLNPNKELLTFETFLIPRYNDWRQMCFENKVVTAKCKPKSANLFRMENGVFMGPTALDIDYKVTERKDYTATYYFSQDAKLNLVSLRNFKGKIFD